ncbi:MAG: hypothetical protein IMZ53_13110 [Thermoplasmata archaeon]|nr:hypothetical protein [Thermoplasmata archaeon]
MKHFGRGTACDIIGLDIEDAIRHNIKTLATVREWDKDAGGTITTIHSTDEVFASYRDGILGGKGGIEVVMRGKDETFASWVECTKEGWGSRGMIKIK